MSCNHPSTTNNDQMINIDQSNDNHGTKRPKVCQQMSSSTHGSTDDALSLQGGLFASTFKRPTSAGCTTPSVAYLLPLSSFRLKPRSLVKVLSHHHTRQQTCRWDPVPANKVKKRAARPLPRPLKSFIKMQ